MRSLLVLVVVVLGAIGLGIAIESQGGPSAAAQSLCAAIGREMRTPATSSVAIAIVTITKAENSADSLLDAGARELHVALTDAADNFLNVARDALQLSFGEIELRSLP